MNRDLFRLVPLLHLSEELLRPGGKTQLEGESKDGVDAAKEVETSSHLFLDLIKSLPQQIIIK